MMDKINKPFCFKFKKVVDQLQNNKAIIMPTDTVIGVIAKNNNLISEIKKRQKEKPIVLFIDSVDKIKNLMEVEKNIIKKYWPGRLTIIKNNISYRVPKSKRILKLIKAVGPLYASSANIAGNIPIKNCKFAFNEFKDSLDKIYVIKGKTKDSYPSTIIDIDKLIVIRRGYLEGEKVIAKIKEASL